MKDIFKVAQDYTNVNGLQRARFIPKVEVIRSRSWQFIVDKEIPYLSPYVQRKSKKVWSSFIKKDGHPVSFPTHRKAVAWLNRKFRQENRGSLGVVKIS